MSMIDLIGILCLTMGCFVFCMTLVFPLRPQMALTMLGAVSGGFFGAAFFVLVNVANGGTTGLVLFVLIFSLAGTLASGTWVQNRTTPAPADRPETTSERTFRTDPVKSRSSRYPEDSAHPGLADQPAL